MVDTRVALTTVSLAIIITLTGGTRSSWRCPSSRLLPHTTRIVPHNGKCYQFVHIETYWTSARNYCRRYGGRLLTIPDSSTNTFIIRTLNSLPWRNRGVWIGLHDTAEELVWEWSTESSAVAQHVAFTNWGRGHPRGIFHSFRDCVRMVRGSGTWKWHETPCAALAWKYRSICQYDMRATTSTSTTTTTTRPSTTTSPPTTTRRPSLPPTTTGTTSTTTHPTTVVQYGVGMNANRLGPGDDMRRDDTVTSTLGVTTEEFNIDVVIPLRLEQDEDGNQNSILQVVVVVSLVAVALALVVIIAVYFRRRRQKKVAEDTVTVANPMYAKTATAGEGRNRIVVRMNGQTAVLRQAKPENVYTDEPIRNNGSANTAAEDGTNITGHYQDMNYASATDQNALNAETEREAISPSTSSSDAVNLRNKSRPVPATPTGQYFPMNGVSLSAIGRPTSGYEEPICQHRVSNIYAEIPDQEEMNPLAENLYESLDEIEKDYHQRFTHA